MTIQEVRQIIYNRDDNKCYKCDSTKRLTFDHIKPKSKYHNHSINNIITLCWKCNSVKFQSELPEDEYAQIQNYLSQANSQFTEEQQIEMEKVITEYYDSLLEKRRKRKKSKAFKLTDDDWNEMALRDKNGKIIPWSIYRIRD